MQLLALFLISGYAAVGAVSIPKTITYVCDDNGNITIKKSQSGLNPYLAFGEGCSNPTGGDRHDIIIKGCKVGTEVKVILMQVEAKGIVKKGDFGEFSLECDQKRLPYNMTLVADIGVTVPTMYPVRTLSHQYNTVTAKPNERLKPKMEITKNGGSARSPITLGDTLTLQIIKHVQMGTTTTLMALECVAKPDIIQPTTYSDVLWSTSGCLQNDLFTGNWTRTNSSIQHGMEAFRFENSKTVEVTCNVRICPDGDPKNKCNLGTVCQQTQSGRRKRDMDHDSVSVTAMFSVQDNYENALSGKGFHFLGFKTLVVVTVLQYCLTRYM